MASGRLNPVAWTEGMFLRPQHFQHHDLYNEERLRYHVAALNPFQWGVRELKVNEDALSEHRFEVLELEAIMPGGTVVRYPGNAIIETREFDPALERLDVHLGLRRLSPTEGNAAAVEDGVRDVRYLLREDEAPDLNRGGFETPVELVFPNLRIFLTHEERDLEVHESFKLAEVVATGELASPFALSPRYVPPLLSLQASSSIANMVAEIVAQIGAKVRVVAGRTTTLSTGDLPRYWMRYTLARCTPLLRHLLSTGDTRPFDIYTYLVDVAGSLAAWALQEPAELPEYDHEDLHGCFSRLIAFIDTHLGEAIPTRFEEIKLQYEAERKFYHAGRLNTDQVDPNKHYYLGVKANLATEDLVRLVTKEGKAGAYETVRLATKFNTAALSIEHLQAAPTEIAGPPGFQYFTLDAHGPKWKEVRDNFEFAINLGALESGDVRLYVVSGGE